MGRKLRKAVELAETMVSSRGFLRSYRIVEPNGREQWFNGKGELHRIDGPAVVHPNDDLEWWVNGQLHRSDGPAALRVDGTRRWYQRGHLHRTDGPAVMEADGSHEWWSNGVWLGSRHAEVAPELVSFEGMLDSTSISNRLTSVDDHGNKFWRNARGQLHRSDAPAVVYHDGSEEWYCNGELHREHAPAVVHAGGGEEWFCNGLRHREDGPAVEWEDGSKEFWLFGLPVTEAEVNEKPERAHITDDDLHEAVRDNLQVVIDDYGNKFWYNSQRQLHRIDGPAMTNAVGSQQEWRHNGLLHREDGPAMVYAGELSWWRYGRLHRSDGPAVIEPGGTQLFYLCGVQVELPDGRDVDRDVEAFLRRIDSTTHFTAIRED